MRIWITGLGVISPLARGAAGTMDRVIRGDRAAAPLTLFQLEGARSDLAAEVAALSVEEVAPPGEADQWSRTDAMSVLAAREALAEAGIDPREIEVDLALGGTTGGMFETEALLAELSRDPLAIVPDRRMIAHPLASTADHVAAAAGPFRRVRSVCSACSGGANAVLLAATWIRSGRSRAALAGGADGLCRLTYAGFGALGALSPEPCRPFDRRRSGLTLGEGAAFLLLEPEDLARARGARPIAELRGWAVGGEAHHITNPEASGETAARVMRAALARAGIGPAEVDYVNAHGTATPLNDTMEAAALRRCLGAEADRVAVSSTKGQIGHTLAAAGAIEAAITAMAIARGVIPPTAGLEEVDEACPLAHVKEARAQPIRAAMSGSFGFGGTDTVLVLADPAALPAPPVAPARRVVVTGAATVGPLGVLGIEGSLAYLDAGPAPAAGAIAFPYADHLDLARARRLDRAARLSAVAIARALREAALPVEGEASFGVGAVMGSAFGSVDATAAFLRRIADKGAKLASPADFPNLVPSSPVGHASIYLGLRGPVVSVSELDVTAESALVTAAELCAAGEGDAIFAGSTEEASALVDRCLGPVCTGIGDRGPRSEGAAVVLLEAADRAEARGARALAEVTFWTSWRGPIAVLGEAPPPALGAAVFAGRDDARLARALAGTAWASAPRFTTAARAGDHEGAGGFAAAAAAAAVAAGRVTAALVVGAAADRGFAALFTQVR